MNQAESTAVEFLAYNRWANMKLFDACCNLPPDVLASTAPGCYGSIYDTLAHIVRGERRYYWLLTGEELASPFSWEAQPPLEEIRPYAEQVSSALLEAAGQLCDPEREVVEIGEHGEEWHYRPLALLIQTINHGIEHRTNITIILSQLGIEAPAVDGWAYLDENMDRLGV